ncbi:MAG: ECF-type riboflavin transporter substrate-binding protein [Tyzzerella sp.]|nr:ECF-type riboflavin transporter substrate-binding protein [Lachnospiraceae bacterium]MBP3663610.1 ECF-type riboflavin transporter substrate-binding protein [Tyzzerella sp.]
MNKKLFDFKTKTIVATGLGAALFMLLFMYVKVPTGIPETQIQTAYGVGGFFAALFGPIAGGLIAFIGHFLSDSVQYGSAWMSWVIASGVTCFIIGMVYPKLAVEEGRFDKKDMILYNVYQIVGNIIGWVIVAPVLDIVIYAEPVNLVFTQGVVAAICNAVSAGVIGTILLKLYSKAHASKGSLTKE